MTNWLVNMAGMTDADLDTRSRILDAAEQAFADGGLAGARVASIAEDAGANKAMLYYYFDSKEALYFAVLERVFEQIAAQAVGAGLDASRTATEALAAFVTGYQGVLAAHPHFARLMMRGLLDHPERILAFLGPRLGRFFPVMVQRVHEGQQKGEINAAVDPLLTMPTLVAPMLFFAFAHPLLATVTGLPTDTLRDRFRANALEIYLNGLLPREDR